MKTIEEILSNYEKEWATFLDDRFGSRLTQFLTEEQMESIGFKLKKRIQRKTCCQRMDERKYS